MSKQPRPTAAELGLLKVLWTHGESAGLTVREIRDRLDQESGYTTVLKLLQIMHGKQLVQRDESERSHRYRAAIEQRHVERGLLGDLKNRLFNGSARQLVQAAIESEEIDDDELEAIDELIQQARARRER